MYVSSGMVILVGMSSMKSFYKNRGKQKETGSHTESFLFCPFLSEELDVPPHTGPNVRSSANILTLSHHHDC